MMKRGESGKGVYELQTALLSLGYTLSKWRLDGVLGDETLRAFAAFSYDHDIFLSVSDDRFVFLSDTPKGIPDSALKKFWDIAHAVLSFGLPNFLPGMFYDQRKCHRGVHRYGKRPWRQVTGVTLHQTACVLGEKITRWADVGCHLGVTVRGKVLWLSDFSALVVHGNSLNSSDVGIEIDGYYEGIEGKPETLWQPNKDTPRPVMPLSESAVSAAQKAVRFVYDLVAAHGGQLKYVHAHRQASKNRQSDPGSAIWQRVALPFQEGLGLSDDGRRDWGGLPIPEAWNPKYKGVKY